MGDDARDRLGIRLYYGDALRHAYRATDLTLACWQQIHPVCHDLDAVPGSALYEQLYLLAHPTDMLDPHEHRHLGSPFTGCGRCAARLRVLPHDIVVGTEIVAVHGHLHLPEPRTATEALPRGPALAGT
jgi:hypothetical protein